MDNKAEKHIPYNGNSYLSEFFDTMRERDELKSQLAALYTKDEKINDKILSFKEKIYEYVQEGMEIAYERLNCDTSTLYALAKYDKTGIFLYFTYLLSDFYEDPTLKGFSRSKSDKELCFDYGQNRTLFIPMDIISQDESYSPREFSDKIIELCKKIVEKLQENLKALRFE